MVQSGYTETQIYMYDSEIIFLAWKTQFRRISIEIKLH